MNTVDIVLSPELIETYSSKPVLCIVIDVLRASSTIITAFANGARRIYPLADIETAQKKAHAGALVGAERNVLRCDFAMFGNDPGEYTAEKVGGQDIYFTTTNGTKTIRRCLDLGHEVIIGGFLNIDAVVRACGGRDVLCVCAGWQGKFCLEDAFFAGALEQRLAQSHSIASDAGRMMAELWELHRERPLDYIMGSDHFARMAGVGKEGAVPYCLTEGIINIVPTASGSNGDEIVLRGLSY